MDTIKGQFAIGLWDDKSKAFQRDFEMRLATLEDTENALEDTPEYASTARIRRHEWAACLLSVGCIPGDEITPERLAELMETLRRYRLEPKALRFVQKNGAASPSLVLLGCRKDGRTGLTVQPPLLLRNADGTETEELRRIYFRDKG